MTIAYDKSDYARDEKLRHDMRLQQEARDAARIRMEIHEAKRLHGQLSDQSYTCPECGERECLYNQEEDLSCCLSCGEVFTPPNDQSAAERLATLIVYEVRSGDGVLESCHSCRVDAERYAHTLRRELNVKRLRVVPVQYRA